MPSLCRPNVILAVFDTLSEADCSRKEAQAQTPVLARLRSESALFTNAYAPCPESSPARASLFTGLDPCAHGVWTNGVALPARERTFPQILAQSGYANWLVGRRQLAGVSNWTTEHCRPDEFSRFEWAHGPLHRSRQNAYLLWLQRTAPDLYFRIFPTQADPDNTLLSSDQRAAVTSLPDDLGFNHWVGARLAQMISAHASDQPYFAVAGFVVGNSMGAGPPQNNDFEGLNDRTLRQADTALGHILEHVTSEGRAEDTVVIITAGRGKNAAETAEGAMREPSIRVPLLMRGKGIDRQIVEPPISTTDVAPTILDLAGVTIPQRMQGASLLGGAEAARGWAMSRLRAPGKARSWQTALRAGHRKLVARHGNPASGDPVNYELFDLDDDPNELNDLAGSPAHAPDLEDMIDLMIDARCALEDRTEPRIAAF